MANKEVRAIKSKITGWQVDAIKSSVCRKQKRALSKKLRVFTDKKERNERYINES